MGALAHPFRSALWLLGSLAFPALAAAQTSEALATSFQFFAKAPPWAVEAPGAAGARFGLGLDVFSERQESLRITGLERFLRALDLGSGLEEGGIFYEDPSLLNRKFDLLLELEGVGGEAALALPGVGAPGAFQIHPTLIFQAAAADVRLDFLDRTRVGDSTSYEGRGPLFTTGLDLTTSLCRSCPWFAGTSYRFQKLPSLSVDRSPAFALPGFAVLGDEVRLARDVHEVSTRVGTSFSGGRLASYLGARYRWTDLEVEDELRYRDSLGVTETRLSSRADLESEATLAVAGVEAHLGGSFYGRMEAGFSEEDRVVLAQVVYLPSRESDPGQTREETASIAAKIRAIRADFVEAFNALPAVVEIAAFLALLDQIEARLLAVLPFPEYAAMHSWVRDRFDRARALLDEPRIVAALASARFLAQDARPEEAFDMLLAMFDLLIKRFENNDILVDLCVRSEPIPGARVDLYPEAFPQNEYRRKVTSHGEQRLRRGLWVAEISKAGFQAGTQDSLDLMDEDDPIVRCQLSRSQSSYCSVETMPSVRGWSCRDAGR